jgi:hypothetical protein
VKLKLDLHPIFSDGGRIDDALASIMDEACDKRAASIEIIPGKGSGALKKSVLRYLDRPYVKSRYHRIEKDSDNWGRLFVHFRWTAPIPSKKEPTQSSLIEPACFCCGDLIKVGYDDADLTSARPIELTLACLACGSPNAVTIQKFGMRRIEVKVGPGYS